MNKLQLLTISAFVVFALILPCCDTPIDDPPIVDPKDTTKVDTLDSTIEVITIDTILIDTIRIDTNGYDTIRTDSLIPVDNDKIVLAYCAYYSSDRLPNPECVTHINYMGAEVYMPDSVYSCFKIKGQESRFKKVVALKKKNPNIKICLSFSHCVENGDNKQSGGFSVLSAHPEMRKQFAKDCRAFVEEWGIDGIDMDWEFPTVSYSGHHKDPADKANFTLLMKDLREALGNDYLLTYAADVMGERYIENNNIEPYVDYINVMCYDLCSAPSPHNAMSCSGYWDIMRTYNSYVKNGYNMSKFVLGVPFYGRHTYDDGEWYYWKLKSYTTSKSMSDIWKEYWSDTWKVPFVKKDGVFWCSFENERSIDLKGQWVNEKGLGGMMYWEASGDDSKYTLSHAVWNAMKTKKETTEEYVLHIDTIQVVDTIFIRDTTYMMIR